PHRVSRGVAHIEVDGKKVPVGEGHVVLADDGRTHEIRVVMGDSSEAVHSDLTVKKDDSP
ncbi:MAG: hypothetical protein M3O41_17285, partial [Pseudomonadota bacterium]|nr:hypothetical protein [Pseudomonadota bacterium]